MEWGLNSVAAVLGGTGEDAQTKHQEFRVENPGMMETEASDTGIAHGMPGLAVKPPEVRKRSGRSLSFRE